ncbi:glucuronyl esterase domain-containing protein [Sphingomonas oryzagri]
MRLSAAITACSLALTIPVALDAQGEADRDRIDMMRQLGIETLRPGPSGDDAAPDHANYDEALANPHPDLPDPLVTLAGKPVRSAATWWKSRRPEIVEAYEREVYGRIPANAPKVTWRVVSGEQERLGFPGTPVLARQMIGHVDNSADPAISVDIRMTVVTPAAAKGPVPLLIMFAPAGFPAPTQPSGEEFGRIDAALKASAVQQDPSLASVFSVHPGFTLTPPPLVRMPERNADGDPMNPEQLAAAGWGFALLDPASVQADDGASLRKGIIGLTNRGAARTPDQWGALRAWAWAASRTLDYFEGDPIVDAKHVGIEGVSRWGKAALVTMAFDQRFAMVLVGSSGKGGATPLRRNWGEDISNLATGGYYWFAGNLIRYDAAKASSRLLDPGDLPVDSNDLIALCAPRLTFISYGVPEKGDARWLDHRGSWMATVSASKVWTLLGAKGIGVAQNYRIAPMPAVNQGLLDGHLAWRQHDGGHTDAPTMKWFLQWANRNIGHIPPPPG